MVAKDGLTFKVLTTSQDIRDGLKAQGFTKIPQSPNTIRRMVVNYARKVRQEEKRDIVERSSKGERFCASFDEWTSLRKRRYTNVILHGSDSKIWNLGLVRIRGSLDAEKCLALVEKRLKRFNLLITDNIVCIITDGASVMTKIGKITTTYQQLCFAHGVQLAVLDVLYKKKKEKSNLCAERAKCDESAEPESESDEEIDADTDDVDDITDNEFIESDQEVDDGDEELDDDDNDDEEVLVILDDFKPVIDKVRKIVKLFNRSPLKNEILQTYVKLDHKKELSLLLDNKTRWNSLISMLERFYTMRACIRKALVDIETNVSVEDDEIEHISDLVNSLKPIQAAVEALCRRDANLITADAVLNFTLGKLQQLDTDVSLKLFGALKKRTLERTTELSGVMQYLHTGNFSSICQNDGSDTDSSETYSFDDIFSIPARKRIESKICDLVERLNSSTKTIELEAKVSFHLKKILLSYRLALHEMIFLFLF